MHPRLVVLGAGSALPRPGLGCSGYALVAPSGAVVLLDLGPGSLRALAQHGIGIERVTSVVLSHEHADHCADLLHLLFARKNPSLADCPPLTVYGPIGAAALVQRTQVWLGRDEDLTGVAVHELDPKQVARTAVGDLLIVHTATGHTHNALAFGIEFQSGYRLTYSGDCGDPLVLVELARGTNLLLCECSAPDDAPLPGHLTPRGVAELAQRAAPACVLLTHFYPDLEPQAAVRAVRARWSGKVAAAHDGLGLVLDPAHLDGWPDDESGGY